MPAKFSQARFRFWFFLSYPITTVISTREENHDIQTLVYKFSKNNHHSIKYLIKRREEYYQIANSLKLEFQLIQNLMHKFINQYCMNRRTIVQITSFQTDFLLIVSNQRKKQGKLIQLCHVTIQYGSSPNTTISMFRLNLLFRII